MREHPEDREEPVEPGDDARVNEEFRRISERQWDVDEAGDRWIAPPDLLSRMDAADTTADETGEDDFVPPDPDLDLTWGPRTVAWVVLAAGLLALLVSLVFAAMVPGWFAGAALLATLAPAIYLLTTLRSGRGDDLEDSPDDAV